MLSGAAECKNLGVGGGIAVLLSSISGAGDDLTAAADDSTDRHLSTPSGGLGLDQSFVHEMPIVVIEDPFRKH